MVTIFYLSSLSKPIKYELPYGADKLLHFAGYVVLGFLMSYSLKKSGFKNYVFMGWILASLYGITDEIHQSFIPMRDASLFDFLADSAGSFSGAYFYKRGNLEVTRETTETK